MVRSHASVSGSARRCSTSIALKLNRSNGFKSSVGGASSGGSESEGVLLIGD
jgi:hypothetical protein